MYRIAGMDESKEWFAFRFRPRHEKQVSLTLREKGSNELLPLCMLKRQRAERKKIAGLPPSPGYIFCSSTRASMAPVLLTTRGDFNVDNAGTSSLPAGRVEVEALQQTMRLDLPLKEQPYKESQSGPMCSVLHGPSARQPRTLVTVRARRNRVFWINLVRRPGSSGVHSDRIEPLVPKVDDRRSA